jgi:putative membrane protein
MRWLHILLVALFVVGTFVFLIQNLEIVTLSFLGFGARTRLGFLVVIFYLLGMVTGGSLSRCCAAPSRNQDSTRSSNHSGLPASQPSACIADSGQ